jgi:hypothetical protein
LDSRSTNRTAHRQIARMNFKELSRVNIYEPGERAKFARQEDVRRAEITELSRVTRLITGSREFRLGSGVYWDSYEATSLNPPIIKKLVREGAVWTSGESVGVATLGGARDRTWREVGFLTGTGDGPMKLVRHVLGLKEATETSRRMVWIPRGSRIIAALRRAGFSRHGTQILFERTASKPN